MSMARRTTTSVPVLASGIETTRHQVMICGGGPVGLALALALARYDIPSVVVEADASVCDGSRAICLSRRSLEILDRLGVLKPFLEKGLGWTVGRSYYQTAEILRFEMPHGPDQRLLPMTNLQQFYIEQFLVDAVEKRRDLIELRWSTTSFLSQTDGGGTHRGIGDNWLGPQIRVYKQTKLAPTLAFGYAVKIPSASSADGLGSGRVDHSFTLLVSKDIAKIHFDFNATEFLIGRPGESGFDKNQQLNLAFSHALRGKLQFTGEFYGDTELNSSTPRFVSSLWALTYTVTPRLVIDGGFETGITSGGPHRHAFVGATYSIANLYPGWRRKRTASPGKTD